MSKCRRNEQKLATKIINLNKFNYLNKFDKFSESLKQTILKTKVDVQKLQNFFCDFIFHVEIWQIKHQITS